jgi:hypothetical protein
VPSGGRLPSTSRCAHLRLVPRWSHIDYGPNVNLQLTTMHPRSADSSWPYPSITTDGHAWADEGVGPLSIGLRRSLVTAQRMLEYDEHPEMADSSEQDRLITAIFYLRELLEQGNEELTRLMAEALYKGASWSDIGRALEVSRQAAHKRFNPGVQRFLEELPARREWLRELDEWQAERDRQRQGSNLSNGETPSASSS